VHSVLASPFGCASSAHALRLGGRQDRLASSRFASCPQVESTPPQPEGQVRDPTRLRLGDDVASRYTIQNFFRIQQRRTLKTNPSAPKTMDEYIAGFPRDVQEILQKIRVTIQKAAPDAEETIKYRMPTFILNGNLVYFAAFKSHIGFYPIPTGIEKFKKELSVYKQGRGSVQFPLDKPIPYDLISRIVKFRVKENLVGTKGK
jgi:uncharacterized protein YdhG (YjbR/CyaY superfamily)